MEDSGCPRRRRSAKTWLPGLWLASVACCLGQAVSVSPRWQVSYPPAAHGRPSESVAVAIPNESILVAVVLAGSDATQPSVRMGNRVVPVQLIGHDPVSRLGFFRVEGSLAPKSPPWLEEIGGASTSLQAQTPDGPVKCRSTGWVKQVGGKILPLALLRVNFDRAVPPPGTPLLDAEGRIAAIVFQSSGNGNAGYAIPAEAIHRVREDVCTRGKVVRGWIGLALRAENQSPQIVRVLPRSPAALAGIRPGDVLLGVGQRQIADYADAANAFFYLTPGQAVKVRILRGADPLDFTLTPTPPQAE